MILATKNGWLIACTLVRETPKSHIVKAWDEKRERRVPKDSKSEKLFDCAAKAIDWIKA